MSSGQTFYLSLVCVLTGWSWISLTPQWQMSGLETLKIPNTRLNKYYQTSYSVVVNNTKAHISFQLRLSLMFPSICRLLRLTFTSTGNRLLTLRNLGQENIIRASVTTKSSSVCPVFGAHTLFYIQDHINANHNINDFHSQDQRKEEMTSWTTQMQGWLTTPTLDPLPCTRVTNITQQSQVYIYLSIHPCMMQYVCFRKR